MKNILKISLLITLLAFAFILLGSTNVNAAAGDIVFKKNLSDTTNATELDFGNIIFGEPSVILTVYAINTTGSPIEIKGYDLPIVSFSKVKNLSRVGSELATPLSIAAGDHIQLQFEIFASTLENFPRYLDCSFVLIAENDERFSLNLKATDVKKTISLAETPTLDPTNVLTYNGVEQTMNFYTYNGIDYTLVDFSAADSLFTITGNKATTAGNHTAQITLKHPSHYKWDDSLLNVSGTNSETYSIEWEIKKIVTPLLGEQEGIAERPLSSIKLPTGWSWDDPSTTIVAGVHNYAATFNHPNDNINYETVNGQISVNGKIQYSVAFNLTPNSYHDAQSNPTYLIKGDSKTYNLSTESGYIFTSIKINDVEQLLNGNIAVTYPINITNIDKNYSIVVETQRIIYQPMEEHENLTFDRYTNETFLMKWDLDFDTFKMTNLRINGIDLKKGFSFKPGSVILELDSTILANLPLGENKIEIDLASGELAVATFNLIDTNPTSTDTNNTTDSTDTNNTTDSTTTDTNSNNPGTGDNIIAYSIITLISIIAIAGIVVIRKKSVK